MSQDIVGILLAAGYSKRFGGAKLLQTLPGGSKPIVEISADRLRQALPNSVAVTRPEDKQLNAIFAQLSSHQKITVVYNPDSALGISSSIRCGILSNPKASGWLIALADMPFIDVAVYREVAQTLWQGAVIAVPEYNETRGHPVGFSCELKDELMQLEGDVGARAIIEKYKTKIQTIKVSCSGILRDIDHPYQLVQQR